MKTNQALLLAGVLGWGLITHPLSAAELGMDAPPLNLAKFVKGDAVELAKGKGSQVYVVEFWATWCGPCKASIPHLTDFQKKNKDHVTLISVAASERKPKEGETDNRLPNLQKFVADQGDKMGYTIAYDGDREMSNDWMKAAGQQFIPTAFVVDGEGKLAWVGTVGDDKGKKGMEEAVEKSVKALDKATNPKKNENKGG